jgi:hypothetical protein
MISAVGLRNFEKVWLRPTISVFLEGEIQKGIFAYLVVRFSQDPRRIDVTLAIKALIAQSVGVNKG